ncbi:hypothetical protein Z948_1557 [Sulfitobacter donghicola DSW-25 = KCTC 12864 = JCM 14565]|nr:hypothetical protein Z948_1557 [Sulfitobacter donghicola DSW-25 = KCTC 12864 = JCM 14565]
MLDKFSTKVGRNSKFDLFTRYRIVFQADLGLFLPIGE